MSFEWDEEKDAINKQKHGISFNLAQRAFLDEKRIVTKDLEHSEVEERYFCIGKVDEEIISVRFTYRAKIIRTFGAGYWRKEKKLYEKQNKIYKR